VLFFADAAGRVVYANRAAEKLLAQNDGLCMKDQTLTAASAAENRALQQLFAAESAESAGLLRIPRRSGKQPYLATRMQVSSDTAAPDARRPSVVVLVHDPEWNMHGRIAALCKRHALTAAECSVVEALLKTGSAKATAIHLRLSDNTIKTHLKSIFSKTDTHRQADLIRLALSFPRL
jgi:DNA-binding CsgD family transcriptional regulator